MPQILSALELLLLLLLAIQVIYSLLFALASLLPYRPVKKTTTELRKIALLFPAYKEDAIIENTVQKALALDYPPELLRIVVGSDQMKAETLQKLQRYPITLLEMNFKHSTKSKNLLRQMEELSDFAPDYVLVMDSDNVMEAGALRELNHYLRPEIKVYQLHRVAKNSNSKLAVLDAISEEISNNIFRRGHRVLGLASSLIGSGMCLHYSFFRQALETIDRNSAVEDKLLEFHILGSAENIEFLPELKVYDEKVAQGKNFSNQRKRWIAGQYHSLRLQFVPGLQALFKGQLNYFDKMLQMALVPKLLFAALLIVLGAGAYFLSERFALYALLTSLYLLALLLAVPRSFYRWQNLGLLWEVPKALFFMVLAVLRIKRNQSVQTFEHTEKTFTAEDEN